MNKNIIFFLLITLSVLNAQYVTYNHSELEWITFETPHFRVHYHNGTEQTAKESAKIAETIYPLVTGYYDFEPSEKTDLIIKDTDDIANGAAYYYDNKIDIWASPLDFLLRGNHSWLRDVVTHEFTHIVSLQKTMKTSRNIPGIYFQYIDYEKEKREDVVRGYPRTIASHPVPMMTIPMWLAEGMAQYQYPGASNDLWDAHRDMILRDRALNNNVLPLDEMGSFGKRGIGNESVYNHGLGFVEYLAEHYGEHVMPELADELAKPMQFSFNSALKKVTGKSGKEVHAEWIDHITNEYLELTSDIRENPQTGEIILEGGSTQIYPEWKDESTIYYLSNKGRDYFSQTSLYKYNRKTGKETKVKALVQSHPVISPDKKFLYYSRKSMPNKYGSIFNDIYKWDIEYEEETRITKFKRVQNPAISHDGKSLAFVQISDGCGNIILYDIETKEETILTDLDYGVQLFSISWSHDDSKIAFDYMVNHGRDIGIIDIKSKEMSGYLSTIQDERDPHFSNDGKWLYYSSDKTGIFNIYRKSIEDEKEELLTNVTGGAFMPAVNENNELIYSIFDKSCYKIATISNINHQPTEYSEYIKDFSKYDKSMLKCENLGSIEEKKYSQVFSKIFVMPKLMVDYGTLKPGFYFFSSEILNQFNLFGGASINKDKEHDIAVLFEYKKLEPTIFLEYYNIKRGLFNKQSVVDGHPGRFDYNFHLQQLVLGLSKPFSKYHEYRFDITLASYRTSVDQEIRDANINYKGFTYNYYKGLNLQLNWKYNGVIPIVNNETNPDNGISLQTNFYRNYDLFLKEFGLHKDFGTLKEVMRKNYYWKIEHEGVWHHKYPFIPLVGNLGWKAGWISKEDIDSFFNLFAGGMPGLRGYPFFSMEGRNLVQFDYTFRYPLFTAKSYQLGPLNLQHAFIGAFIETGNAWSQVKGYKDIHLKTFVDDPIGITSNVIKDFKTDVGAELRLSGLSFYGFPTAISLDVAYGLDNFLVKDQEDKIHEYGKELRYYLTILFGL